GLTRDEGESQHSPLRCPLGLIMQTDSGVGCSTERRIVYTRPPIEPVLIMSSPMGKVVAASSAFVLLSRIGVASSASAAAADPNRSVIRNRPIPASAARKERCGRIVSQSLSRLIDCPQPNWPCGHAAWGHFFMI